MFNNKSLKKLIIPLIIDQFLAIAIGMADTIMVSSCGEAAVSGISLVDSINFLFITIFTALATGGAVVSAQYIGKGDREESCESANQLFYSVLFLSVTLSIITLIFNNYILKLVFGNIEADVMANARIYFLLSALSYPFIAIFNAGAALLRSAGDSKTSMYTSVFMNGINVTGNAIFIFGFSLGVTGAGLASLISRVLGAVFITYLLTKSSRKISYRQLQKVSIKFSYIKKILYIGIPNGIENGLFQIGKLMVASIVAGFGTASITANAIGGNLASIQFIPGSAIGMALVTVVGQCVGADLKEEASKYTKKLLIIGCISMASLGVLLILLMNPILSIYNVSEEAIVLTKEVFTLHAIIASVIWIPSFALPNALRAGGDVKFTMWVALISMWIFRIGCSYVLALWFNLGLLGIWIAMFIDWLFRAIVFGWRFLKSNWIKNRLV